ncbi:MAG: DUF3253 domain-containing protein [Acetobacteraceae bacterium]|nr:DUF3253 domain-containing protein [Acetobacteraceae bacterium]
MAGPVNRAAIGDAILSAVSARGAGKSICPSEVAKALRPEDWRPLMHAVRQEAAELSRQGRVVILRKGKPIPPEAMHGVIRLTLPGAAAAEGETA